jgi:Fur family transcriptional regulator, zinc uptake regulator
MSEDPGLNPFVKHNHRQCRTSGLREAQDFCTIRGLRLTPVRARVLEILLESHSALGAYDILDRLKADGLGGQPPVVYRALDFLVEHGFVHRLERLNAFAACAHPATEHEAMFLICSDCNQVAETSLAPIAADIDRAALALGFGVESRVVEVVGRCPACQVAA